MLTKVAVLRRIDGSVEWVGWDEGVVISCGAVDNEDR